MMPFMRLRKVHVHQWHFIKLEYIYKPYLMREVPAVFFCGLRDQDVVKINNDLFTISRDIFHLSLKYGGGRRHSKRQSVLLK